MLCHSFHDNRRNLLVGASNVLKAHGIAVGPNDYILQILPYGDEDLAVETNKQMLELTI